MSLITIEMRGNVRVRFPLRRLVAMSVSEWPYPLKEGSWTLSVVIEGRPDAVSVTGTREEIEKLERSVLAQIAEGAEG